MGKQVNSTPDIHKNGKQTMLEKMRGADKREEKRESQLTVQELEIQAGQPVLTPATKGGRTLKQAAFAIGTVREVRLDELALAYNKQNGTRIGRNDIIRYLIDTLQLEDLLITDLRKYKK
jgi:hypothetical protein